MRSTKALLTLALVALMSVFTFPTLAADLGTSPSVEDVEAGDLRPALSRYLSLLEIRATFDVVERDAIPDLLAEQLSVWRARSPGSGELAELDRHLLSEASYYLVQLQYLVDVGGAAFPGDKSESAYRNDTLVRIDALQKRLALAIADGGDVLPILVETEQVRALTEGHAIVPAELSMFADHDRLLDTTIEEADKGVST